MSYMFLVYFLISGSLALRDVKVSVPVTVKKGQDAQLNCTYDIEEDNPYSVRWYLGKDLFFSYNSNDSSPIKLYKVDGIDVIQNESTNTNIVLRNVSRETSGNFTCEVCFGGSTFVVAMQSDVIHNESTNTNIVLRNASGETNDNFTSNVYYRGSTFVVAMQSAELMVVDIPIKNPYITVDIKETSKCDYFQANCTLAHFVPAANFTWYINGLPINGSQISKTFKHHGNYITAISMVRHHLNEKLFIDNRLKLRCATSIYDFYDQSAEAIVKLIKENNETYFDCPNEDLSEVLADTTIWYWYSSAATTELVPPIHMLPTLWIILAALKFL